MFAVFRKLKPLLYHNTYKSVPISVFYRRIKAVLMQIFMILMYSGPLLLIDDYNHHVSTLLVKKLPKNIDSKSL